MIILASMIDEPGDLVKFQTLYSLYSGAMYTTAFNILENADDAEDAVQISSLKIIKNLNRLEMEEIHDIKTKSFLLTIARNTDLDIWRKRKKEPVSVEEVEMDGLAPSAEKIYFDKVSVNNLAEAIGRLDGIYQDVLRLYYVHELPSKEIGKILNINHLTVNTRLKRAREKLFKMLKEEGA